MSGPGRFPEPPVVIVGGLHADARRAAVARLLADVPGSVCSTTTWRRPPPARSYGPCGTPPGIARRGRGAPGQRLRVLRAGRWCEFRDHQADVVDAVARVPAVERPGAAPPGLADRFEAGGQGAGRGAGDGSGVESRKALP
ncbi:hypothetical protein STENM327S_05109 [Streptomyces tendae]